MYLDEYKDELRKRTVVSRPPVKMGGQHVGLPPPTIIVENESLGVRIEMTAYSSQHKNREMALLLLDLIIDDVLR